MHPKWESMLEPCFQSSGEAELPAASSWGVLACDKAPGSSGVLTNDLHVPLGSSTKVGLIFLDHILEVPDVPTRPATQRVHLVHMELSALYFIAVHQEIENKREIQK